MKKYRYYALEGLFKTLPRVIRMDEHYDITIYDTATNTWKVAPDYISFPDMCIGKIEADLITEEQANEIIQRRIAVCEENLKRNKPQKSSGTAKVRPERVKQYMEISATTKTFAQHGDSYLLTNEQEWDYETADHTKIMACKINVRCEEITPCLPLSRFTNHDPYWMIPDRQLTPEELEKVKHYTKI